MEMENEAFSKYRTPVDYLKVFFRRKWLLAFPAFFGLVLGIMASLLLPPTWESSTVILVEEERTLNPIMQNLAVSTTAAQRMQSIREIILGWNSLVELTKKLDLAKGVQSQAGYEGLILGLRKNIFVQMNQQNIIRISYQGKNPQETQLVAKTLTDILVDRNMKSQTKETDVAIEFIKEQLTIYKRKIKESEVSKLEEELKTLLVDSTEQHPLVKELRGKLTIARKELDSGEYEVKVQDSLADNPTREALKQELDKLINKDAASASGAVVEQDNDANKSIYKLLLMDKVDSALARDINVNVNIYNMLLQKLETAKITQRLQTSREGTRYTVLDPPRLPLNPVKPKKPLVVLMGLFLGAACGVGLVFASEFMDQSVLDIEDAKQILTSPILGAISRITTKEEIDKANHLRKISVTFSCLSAAVLIISAVLISLFRK